MPWACPVCQIWRALAAGGEEPRLAVLFAVLDVNVVKLGAELIGELVADIHRAVLAASAANGDG